MNHEFFPVAAFVLAGFAILALIAMVVKKKAGRRIEMLAPAFELGTTRSAGPLSNGIIGLYRGYTCRYFVLYPSQYDRGGAILRIGLFSPHQWSAHRATTGSRLLVKVGLAKDLEIGDRELDENFRFTTDDVNEIRSVLGVETVRDAIHVLMAGENFESIELRTDRMDLKWSPRDAGLDDDPDVLRRRLEAATLFASASGYSPSPGQ